VRVAECDDPPLEGAMPRQQVEIVCGQQNLVALVGECMMKEDVIS
jgi:hypothetical protein